MNKKLLIVEDDEGLQSQMRWCFSDMEVEVAEDRETALSILRRVEPQVVTLDLGLPPDPGGASEGFALLQDILTLAPSTKVIVVTGCEERENAVKAVGMGACDFYQKPVDADILNFVVNRAFRLHELEQKNAELENRCSNTSIKGLITADEGMLKVCRTVEKLASTDVSVLIQGETGTGKELLARGLHDLGPRKDGPFIAINCSAIPHDLLESELFGHEKGAFTGAVSQKKGQIEQAHRGTLFLDEIGDMPLPLQAKLLRFLQERVIRRVGGSQEIPVDVRVVCATHHDVRKMVESEGFREDLFYRLGEIVLEVPPLRKRAGDAVLIAQSIKQDVARNMDKTILGFSEDAIRAIQSHHWPGNIRELINRVRRAVIMCETRKITARDLELDPATVSEMDVLNLRQVREEAERRAIMTALQAAQFNMAKAARLLGITRPTLYNLTDKYKIDYSKPAREPS